MFTSVHGLLLTHVDDIMLMAEKGLVPLLQKALQDRFPVDEWALKKTEQQLGACHGYPNKRDPI